MSRNQFSSTALGFAVGIGIGAALGLLLAPKSGEETRNYLLGGVRDVVDDAVATGLHATKRAREAVDEVTSRLKEAAGAGERAYSKAKEA
jgi:gas vesicle protein